MSYMVKRKSGFAYDNKKSAQAVLARWLDLDRELVNGQQDLSRGVHKGAFAYGHHVVERTINRDLEKFNAIGQLTDSNWVRGPARTSATSTDRASSRCSRQR